MRVERYTDQVGDAAQAYSTGESELRRRDARQGQPVRRWLAYDGDAVVGAATTWLRPDGRLFLQFGALQLDSVRPLTREISDELGCAVYASVNGEDDLLAGLLHAGYRPEIVLERFEVPFESVLDALSRAPSPRGFEILSARDADLDRLFDLDNRLRRLVPGTDGWVGDIDWMRSELAEQPPFDPDAYLVAVAGTGEYAGLVRIWRNETGPRFGLVGVLPEFRRTLIGPDLIRRAVDAASTWGPEFFTTETELGNRHIHRRLHKLGARSVGFTYQLVFEPNASFGARVPGTPPI